LVVSSRHHDFGSAPRLRASAVENLMADGRDPLLAGVRVLSVGHTLPAMYCIPVLRDLGAEVTLVEAPAGKAVPNRYGRLAGLFPTDSLLAGTARCRINLRDAGGREAYLRLARQVDVVLEGFRPGASDRLGIGYDAVRSLHPSVIYAAISGYGQDGPARARVGHDLNYLAATGVLHLTGDPGIVPAVPGAPFADGLAGLNAAINLVAALWRRTQTGAGCYLDVAITDGPAFLMAMEYDYARQAGRVRQRGDTHMSGGYPWYHVFETADGRYLSVAAVEPHFYTRLCELLGHPELASRQFVDGAERRAQFETFAAIFKSKRHDEWVALLQDEDVCVAPVRTPGEAGADMQTSRGGPSVDGEPQVRSPIRLEVAARAPSRGTAAVLTDFGFSADEIRTLREQGCIAD
jgi:crotonobetainyl-CoA:carnitine CoA-transferase CaiB-like acyl-CoA transferase